MRQWFLQLSKVQVQRLVERIATTLHLCRPNKQLQEKTEDHRQLPLLTAPQLMLTTLTAMYASWLWQCS